MESNAVDQQSFSDNASIIVRDNEMSRPTFPTQAEGANVFSTDLDGLDKVITSIIENASDDDSDEDDETEGGLSVFAYTRAPKPEADPEAFDREAIQAAVRKLRGETRLPQQPMHTWRDDE